MYLLYNEPANMPKLIKIHSSDTHMKAYEKQCMDQLVRYLALLRNASNRYRRFVFTWNGL